MRRLGLLLLALWLLAAGAPALAAEPAATVRVIATDFVLPGKIARLDGWARPTGLSVEATYVETAKGEPSAWLADAALVVLDTPRGNDLAQVMARAGETLAATKTPWIRVGGGPPASGNLPPAVAQALIGYYGHGGEANLKTFVAYVAAWRAGQPLSGFPPPETLPATGFYHPDAPRPFATLEDYLGWSASRWPSDAPRLGLIASSGAVSSVQTGLLDVIVRRAEAAGVAPFVFWFESRDANGIGKVARPAALDAIANLQHLQNGPARIAEFEALGVPVLQTITSREGGVDAWRNSVSGVPAPTAAVFLATPEGWGLADPLVIGAVEDGEPVAIPEQVDALVAKAARLAALRRTPAADKRLALMFWNHPGGEKNLGASNLNVPRSLEALTTALANAGYDVPPATEAALIADAQSLLAGYYRPETLPALHERGLAAALPLATYRAWFATLPEAVRREVTARWGEPQSHWSVRTVDGAPAFLIPRLALGRLSVMPQPPRADRVGESYHDTKVPPGHLYLAAYLYVREALKADALIHFGTHGTQEWTPGKDRGLSINDYPFLAVGDLPVFYPYIQDNVSEAIQARRRGRAVTISHQTPPFAPAGLYDELRDLHGLVHEYDQLEDGPVRGRTAVLLRAAAIRTNMAKDLGWTPQAIDADFPAFMVVLHDHLHALAQTVMPLGLHTFGEAAHADHRLSTVMQQLGAPFYAQLGLDPKELFAEDFTQLQQSEPYVFLRRHLREGGAVADIADPELRATLERAARLDRNLAETGEMEALLVGLAGGFVRAGPGGDPVRNPEVPSGRNLYAFEPDKLPTSAAYAAGGEALEALIAAYRKDHGGEAPRKLAFTLWSGEAIRTLGIVEAQALQALGLRPVWDAGGRVTALEIVPGAELKRPRIDVVFQVTSVYRDQFDGFMRLVGGALERLSALDEPGNTVAENSRAVSERLVSAGQAPEDAARLASLRMFSNEPGDYGSGLPGAVLASTGWDDEAELADRFLDRLQYAYGAQDWGLKTPSANLFAEQLKGVQVAVLSRSSNVHGVLSTDHPFEYLGGLSLAVRRLDGRSPDLYITDARGQTPRVRTAASFLADELRARYLNPQWIGAMQAEGYAGTLEVLDAVNNLFGWQVTDPSMVRADQWQAMHETYVMDRRNLGVNRWFEAANPTAQAQLVERMAEAVRKGYWNPDARTRRELAERWRELTSNIDAQRGPAKIAAALAAMGGFGLAQAAAPAGQAAAAAATASADPAPSIAPPPPPVRGRVLQKVAEPPAQALPQLRAWAAFALLGLLALLGALQQAFTLPPRLPEYAHARP